MSQEFPEKPPEPVFEKPVPMQPEPTTREERRASSAPWIGGAILILLGLIFLLRNFGIFDLHNWWALFILIPAIASLANAWRIYQANGNHMTAAVRGPTIGGLILVLVAAAFLFDLNWGLLWPVILIVIGLAALLTGLGR